MAGKAEGLAPGSRDTSASARWARLPHFAERRSRRVGLGGCLPQIRGAKARPKRWLTALRTASWTPGLSARSLWGDSSPGRWCRATSLAAAEDGHRPNSSHPGPERPSCCESGFAELYRRDGSRLRNALAPSWWEAPQSLQATLEPTTVTQPQYRLARRPAALHALAAPSSCGAAIAICAGDSHSIQSPRDSDYGVASWQLSPVPLASITIPLTPQGSEYLPSPRDSEFGLNEKQLLQVSGSTEA
mmetsp:Transcript_44495/g.102846  ORF Transcript_44495/g.102846 Transcript_44495/m.102846 type:complete len:245 (+) Transcript_44495:36-770(+)